MSLVGPRPERPEIASRLVEHLPAYPQRLAVPPGVTGLAQVELPPDHELEDVRRKLAVDLEYLHRADWRLDLWILYRTGLHLFGLGRPLAVAVEPEVLDAARGGGSDAGRRTIRIDEPQPRRAAGSGPKRRQPQEATASASRKAA